MKNILIQQDGRIQISDREIDDRRTYFHTVETGPMSARANCQYLESALALIPTIKRTFRLLGTEGEIQVWVEV